jgi:hypothetical protein
MQIQFMVKRDNDPEEDKSATFREALRKRFHTAIQALRELTHRLKGAKW